MQDHEVRDAAGLRAEKRVEAVWVFMSRRCFHLDTWRLGSRSLSLAAERVPIKNPRVEKEHLCQSDMKSKQLFIAPVSGLLSWFDKPRNR